MKTILSLISSIEAAELKSKWTVALILTAMSFYSISASATVIDADWKVPGDSLAILDTTNQMKWLDLSLTANKTTGEVESQLGAGGLFEGWRFATAAEAAAMLTSAGATNLNSWNLGNVPCVEHLFDIWGELGPDPTFGNRASYFAFHPQPNVFATYTAGGITLGSASLQPGLGWAGEAAILSNNPDRRKIDTGVALVQNVPEPSSLILAGIAGIGLVVVARRRRSS